MRDAARRARLKASLERHLTLLFPGRVLPVTQAIAARWEKDFTGLDVTVINPWAESND
jgi:hypothetical protein